MRKFYFNMKLNGSRRFVNTAQILKKPPIIVSNSAWDKMKNILNKNNNFAFLFSAKSGGCNGFNYNLETINKERFNNLIKNHPMPISINEGDTKLVIDSSSELLLIGSTIDYIEEDYKKNIFENKFIFGHQKELATSCGCGVSFSPK